MYYVAPRFSDWSEYEVVFQAKKVLENSLLLKPSEITRGIKSTGGAPGTHRIAYDYGRRYVCSDPVSLNEIRAAEFAEEVEAKLRQDETTLENHLERLAFRETMHDGPGTPAAVRANPLFERAKSRVDALAAMVGIEAWS